MRYYRYTEVFIDEGNLDPLLAMKTYPEVGYTGPIVSDHTPRWKETVALKVNCDLQLTLMASSLYRYLGQRIGNGYETVKSRHLFRDFIDATAQIEIEAQTIEVHFQKRAHNPLLVAAGLDKSEARIPWLGNKRLRLRLG